MKNYATQDARRKTQDARRKTHKAQLLSVFKSKNLIFGFLLHLFLMPAAFAGINWDSGLNIISADPCSGNYHLQAYSFNGPQIGNAVITLQVLSGMYWQEASSYDVTYLEGTYDFFLTKHPFSSTPSMQSYRVVFNFEVDINDPMGHWNGGSYNWETDPENVNIYNYPVPPQLYVNTPNEIPSDLYTVDNCGMVEHALLFDIDLTEEYAGKYTFWEADATGQELNIITTATHNTGGPGPTDFSYFFGLMQSAFTNLLNINYTGYPGYQGYTGYVIAKLEITHKSCTGKPTYYRNLFFKINETPYISSFVFKYEDPNGNPTNPTFLSFTPSQDPQNPTQIGGGTGQVFATITTQNYDDWNLNIYYYSVTGNILVSSETGTGPLSTNYQRRVCAISYGSGNTSGITDNPCDNYDETYMAELTVGTDACGADTYYGYFTVPFSKRHQITNNSFIISTSEQRIEIETSHSSNYIITIYSMNGQLLTQNLFNENKLTLSQTNLPPGMYIINIQDENGNTVWRQKFVK